MCELYFWWDLVRAGGVIGFHDTNWEVGRMDVWCGIEYANVKEGMLLFFNIDTLNHESEAISVKNYDEHEGLTFVKKKKEYDFREKRKKLGKHISHSL